MKRLIFVFIFVSLISIFAFILYSPLYYSNEVIIDIAVNPFNIVEEQPKLWEIIKILFVVSFLISNITISNFIYSVLFHGSSKKSKSKNGKANVVFSVKSEDLSLYVGNSSTNTPIYLSKDGLYQNILVTGTIGSGKTSSAMYPFTEQLISYRCKDKSNKLGMLILDVKGNYYSEVYRFCKKYNRLNDLITIDLSRED